MSYAGFGQVFPGGRGNSNDGSPTRGNSNDGSPTRTEVRSPTSTSTSTEVRSPTSTSTSTEVRSPTSTSTDAYTRGNITVTGGAGEGAYTNVRVYQGLPVSYPERKGRAAGRTQERIVNDTIRGLMAPRPAGVPIPLQPDTVRLYGLTSPRPGGTPIPLQEGATTQKVGLTGLGNYSGLGQVQSGRITAGALAKTDPFVSKASFMASNVMKKMVPIPQKDRAAWLRRNLNGLWPRMGDEVMVSIAKITASGKTRDQAVFDAIRLALANRLLEWASSEAAKRGGMSGLGDFASDARTFACTGASLSATTGGWVGAFRPGADTAIVGGATAGAGIANCNLESLRLQAEIAAHGANAAVAAAAAGSASSSRMALYIGGGVLGLVGLAIVGKVLLK